MIEVRHSNPDDALAIRALYSGLNAAAGTLQLPYSSAKRWTDFHAEPPPGSYSLVAMLDAQLAGQLVLQVQQAARRKHVGHLGMAVRDDLQRQGVGSALVAAATDFADNWLALTRLELTVYTDNESAVALYKKFGFVVEGEARDFAFRHGKYVDAFYMARLISN